MVEIVKKEKKLVCGVGRYVKGKYLCVVDGIPTKHYGRWSSMLSRCYDPVQLQRSPAYLGCTVDTRFHEFQDYMEWAELQVGSEFNDYQLDKDLLFRGNKAYSPETCVFLPGVLNNLLLQR